MLITFLKTDKKESRKTRLFRWGMGFFPAIFASGAKVLFISEDWHEIHVKLRLTFWTQNYVKTIFGGSMFSAADWQFMIMLSKILGKDFIVWDKAASIKFKRPGKETLYAKFLFTPEHIAHIQKAVLEKGETELVLPVKWQDKNGNVIAEIDRIVYAATKPFYKAKIEARKKKHL